MYKLFLDDVRQPMTCIHYMHTRIGPRNPIYAEEWTVARNYDEFVDIVKEKGIPGFVSYDHDLAYSHYDPSTWKEGFSYYEETGYDCAKWLKEYCETKGIPHPEYAIHSMNPIGTERIKNLLK